MAYSTYLLGVLNQAATSPARTAEDDPPVFQATLADWISRKAVGTPDVVVHAAVPPPKSRRRPVRTSPAARQQ